MFSGGISNNVQSMFCGSRSYRASLAVPLLTLALDVSFSLGDLAVNIVKR